MNRPAASLSRVSRVFPGGNAGLGLADLEIRAGEMVALLGPSGCGKSTLLRLVAGLETPDSGTVSVGGEDPRQSRSSAFILQDPALLPWLTVRENASLLLKLRGTPEKELNRLAELWLGRLGLADKASNHPWSLSGGERMRVSLARALGLAPGLFLFDEPFAALDEMSRESLQDDLHALRLQQGWAGLFVTHSVDEAAFLADRVVILGGRPGRVKQIVEVGLPLLRDAALRGSPAFSSVAAAIREALRS